MTGVQTCALPICFPVTIAGLSQEDKIKLYDEIKNECDSKEKEFIATQAKIQQYQQEYNNELEKIKVLG